MYRSFTITHLLRRSIISLGLVVLLPSCTLTDAPSPEAITAAIVQTSTPAPEAVVETTQVAGVEHKVAWESLIITVPAQAMFHSMPSVAAPATHGLPLIAAAGLTYPTPPTDGVELNGPNFMLFQFDGTAEDWIELERKDQQPQSVSSTPITVIEESVQPRTIAGIQGLAYQFDLRSQEGNIIEHYAVKLNDEQLLVIVMLDAENPTYQSVINTLQRQ